MGLLFISGYLWTPHARQRLFLFIHSFIWKSFPQKKSSTEHCDLKKKKKKSWINESCSVEVALPLSWLSPRTRHMLSQISHPWNWGHAHMTSLSGPWTAFDEHPPLANKPLSFSPCQPCLWLYAWFSLLLHFQSFLSSQPHY